ncbi:ribonuclease E/G [Roseovarius rhodophyticola]|uniref:Ribonuclease E/G n=1 Tax=Roseovarius rhodophyticola TaxID=3080827 RepID=A0ABZ2TBR5_9RHOB|nr:ribonuclease E/G [Roseovarius sp. W115]MDV2930841.1 ribonuclease E/G [Roseovarius sp. W115]
MKGRVVALGHVGEAEAAALIEDGQLVDFLRDSDQPRPGTIYRAISDRPVKGQGGMFVKTPDGMGFLRNIKGLGAGKPILVQVTGYAEPGKAIPVAARLLFKSRYAIVTPHAPGVNVSRAIRDEDHRDALVVLGKTAMDGCEAGLILRSSCAEAEDDAIAEDIAQMVSVASQVAGDADEGGPEKLLEGDGPHELAWRDWPQPDLWSDASQGFEDHGVLDLLDGFMQSHVKLSGGASLYVEPTRALIAVDVNTGADTSASAGLKANLAAAQALPRELRVRGLGGQVVLDLAPMPKRDRRAFESALRAAFRKDTVETTLVGWTPLGHYELQRKRDRLPLSGGMT